MLPPVQAGTPDAHSQTLSPALQTAALVLPSQVSALPHLQTPLSHISSLPLQIIPLHASSGTKKQPIENK
jgi:hypothetical protein